MLTHERCNSFINWNGFVFFLKRQKRQFSTHERIFQKDFNKNIAFKHFMKWRIEYILLTVSYVRRNQKKCRICLNWYPIKNGKNELNNKKIQQIFYLLSSLLCSAFFHPLRVFRVFSKPLKLTASNQKHWRKNKRRQGCLK